MKFAERPVRKETIEKYWLIVACVPLATTIPHTHHIEYQKKKKKRTNDLSATALARSPHSIYHNIVTANGKETKTNVIVWWPSAVKIRKITSYKYVIYLI